MKCLIPLFFLFLCFSCGFDDVSTPEDVRFISASVSDRELRYDQVDLENVNVSNTYFDGSKQTWMQAYKNREDASGGFWQIRIAGLDLLRAPMPYNNWQDIEATVSWHDETVSPIDDERCGGVDQGCAYIGSTTEALQLVIQSVEDDVVTGEFSGRLFLQGTGFGVFRDESQYIDVVVGAFNIEFRTSEE